MVLTNSGSTGLAIFVVLLLLTNSVGLVLRSWDICCSGPSITAVPISPGISVSRTSGLHQIPMPSSSVASAGTSEQDKLLSKKGFQEGDKVVLFDGVCNLCNGWVNFVLSMKRGKEFKFAALQSEAGGALMEKFGRDPGDLSSLVLIDSSNVYTKSTAVLKVMQEAGNIFVRSFAATALLVPTVVRDWVYSDVVAPSRYAIFGKTDACRRPSQADKERFLS